MSSPPPDAPSEVLTALANDYEATLAIPDHKPTPQWVLLPVGLLGAGKTTVVKPLAAKLGLIRLSTDEVRKMLWERGYSFAGCRNIIHELSTKYLGQGYSIAIDANAGSTFGLEYNKKIAATFPHVWQIFIHINPPESFIIEKLKNYQHDWLFRDSEHAVESFLHYKETFVLPDLPFAYTFDPSRADLPEQLGAGVRAIEKILSNGHKIMKKVSGIIIRDKKLLLVSSTGRPFFWTPGGKIQDGETITAALKRELREELNLETKNHRPYFTYLSSQEEDGTVREVHNYLVEDSAPIQPGAEIDRIVWVNREDFETGITQLQSAVRSQLFPRLIADGLI